MSRLTGGGKMADLSQPANAGARFPVKYTAAIPDLAASTDFLANFITAEEGTIRHFAIRPGTITGTITVDIQKNGTSVLNATFTLASATTKTLEGFASNGVTGNGFNTNTAANRAALEYAKGDRLLVSVTASAASTSADTAFSLTCDERQPLSKFVGR